MANFFENLKAKQLNNYLKSSQTRSYFVTLITILFILIFIFFGIWPAYSAIFDQYNANIERDNQIKILKSTISNLEKVDSEYKNNIAYFTYLDSLLINESGFQSQIINRIYSFTNSRNISVVSLTFTDRIADADDKNIKNLSKSIQNGKFSLTLSGTLQNILAVVKEIENSRFIFNLESINITKNKDSSSGIFSASLNIEYFFWTGKDVFIR